MIQLHLDHVRAHVARLREGQIAVADPEATFLGAQDKEGFEELVGLRLVGMASAMLAVFRFQAQTLPGISFARESLSSYLANPPLSPMAGRFAAPAGRIAALPPRVNEAIPAFLKGLRAGRETSSLALDPTLIRVAFDFRGHNPSAVGVLKQGLRNYVLRTVEGHLITGRSRSLGARQSSRFIALSDVHQLMPQGRLRLPELIIDASWIGLWSDVTEDANRLAAPQWAPFVAAEANPEIVIGIPDAATAPAAPPSPAARPQGKVHAG